jgi:hypothetical protein
MAKMADFCTLVDKTPTHPNIKTMPKSSWCEDFGIALNSLPAMGAHERPLFEKLLWGLVSSTIFVRC